METHGVWAIRSLIVYLVVLPLLTLAVLAVLRVRFAIRFWRRLYLIGLLYVALLLARLALQLLT